MKRDVLHEDMIIPYRDARIKSKLLERHLRPFVEDGHLFFASPEDNRYRVTRVPAYSYGALHQPHQPEKTFLRHQEYLRHLTEVCGRLTDIAGVLGIRMSQLYPLLDRYEVDYSHYRQRRAKREIPEHVDAEEFRAFYEDEAYSIAELSDYYELSRHEAYWIIDTLELTTPLDSVKLAKRSARNPDYGTGWRREKPRPSPVQLAKAMEDGVTTVEGLAELFETNHVTMAKWLRSHGLSTPGMKKWRKDDAKRQALRPELVREALFEHGQTIQEVADAAGTTFHAVWRIARELPEWNGPEGSIQRGRRIGKDVMRGLACAIRERKMTREQAAKACGVSYKTFKKRLDAYEAERMEGNG